MCQNCRYLRTFLGVKFRLRILLRVKELTFRNSDTTPFNNNLPNPLVSSFFCSISLRAVQKPKKKAYLSRTKVRDAIWVALGQFDFSSIFLVPPKAISWFQHFIFGPKSPFEGGPGRPSKASRAKRKLSYLVRFGAVLPGFWIVQHLVLKFFCIVHFHLYSIS